LTAQQEGSSRLVVIQPVRDWACAECGGSGDLLRMDDAGPLCLTCADLTTWHSFRLVTRL